MLSSTFGMHVRVSEIKIIILKLFFTLFLFSESHLMDGYTLSGTVDDIDTSDLNVSYIFIYP